MASGPNGDARALQEFRRDIARAAHGAPSEALTAAYSDAYLAAVLAVPGRAYDYAVDKLARCLRWRATYGADELRFAEVAPALRNGSLYWCGYDHGGHPVLWVRPKQKDWARMAETRDLEIRAHVFMIELACREFMRQDIAAFTVIADAAGLGWREVDLRLMHGLVSVCVQNYPDRIARLCVGPVNMAVQSLAAVLTPLLPPRLREKLVFLNNCTTELREYIPESLIPTYFGGSAVHAICDPGATGSNDGSLDDEWMIRQQRALLTKLQTTDDATTAPGGAGASTAETCCEDDVR